jgi:hypothetical protein
MFGIFQAVGEAVKLRGFRGLCDFVPGGAYLLDVAGDAYRILKERKRYAELKEELAKVAACSTDEARKVAAEVAKQVANEAKPDEQVALELYLTQIPGAVRAS